jgi:two-component system nitrogen regulation response regulator NtrX
MSMDILIVDDEADIRDLVAGLLEDEDYATRRAGDSETALEAIDARRPSLVILDIWLQGSPRDGLEVLDIIKRKHPHLPVIIISGHGNIETAVSAIKRGAYDFIEKPFKTDHLLHLVSRATESDRLRRENEELRAKADHQSRLIGNSPELQSVRQVIEKVAASNSRVLISGAPGSGKEVAARQLHTLSQRWRGPFVVINAAAIAPDRMEIELFGTEGADDEARKIGVFEQAHGGTLFLDEVADMPLQTQSKILRLLTEQIFERVGGHRTVQVDVRVVSATCRDLRQEIAQGNFREDLYHRLNVVPIKMPSLQDRRQDIPLLCSHFMDRIAKANGLAPCYLDDSAIAVFQAFDWPGNVRQLRNVIERLLILSNGTDGPITADMLPEELTARDTVGLNGRQGEIIIGVPLREAREAFEREYLRLQINRFGGNISRTASFVGMERSALHRKLKSLGIQSGER